MHFVLDLQKLGGFIRSENRVNKVGSTDGNSLPCTRIGCMVYLYTYTWASALLVLT